MWYERMIDYDIEDFEYLQDLLLAVDDEGSHYPPSLAEQDNTTDLHY